MEVSCAPLPAAAASEQAQWRALAAGAEGLGFRAGGEAEGALLLESPGEAGEGGAEELSAGRPRPWAPAEAAAAAAPLCAAMDVDEARLHLRGMDAGAAGAAAPSARATSDPDRGADPEVNPAAAPGADRGGRFMAELAAAMAARRDERGAAGGRSPLALALEARPRKRAQARLGLDQNLAWNRLAGWHGSSPLPGRRPALLLGMFGHWGFDVSTRSQRLSGRPPICMRLVVL